MVRIEYHDDLNIVQADPVLASWLCAPAAHAPFDRLAWWQGLERHCCLKPLLAIARDEGEAVILPLRRESGHLAALANWYTFRFRHVFTPNASQAMVEAMARDLSRISRRIDLAMVPDEEGSATQLETAFQKQGWFVIREVCDSNHVLEVGDRSHAQYLSDRPGALRATLKRKSGRMKTIVVDRFDKDAWQAFEDIYLRSWKPAEGSPEFLREFACMEGAAGRLRLGLALIDDKPVAAQFWTVERGTAFIHKLAHLEEAKSHSPGTVLTSALFEHVIDRDRVSLVDFGTGDDRYKQDWMELVRMRYRLIMLRPSNPANWAAMVRAVLRRIGGAGRQKPGTVGV